MNSETLGLLVLGHNQTLEQFFESLDPNEPLPTIGCVVADSQTKPGLKTLTCWQHQGALLDVSPNLDVLVDTWKTHVDWHSLTLMEQHADDEVFLNVSKDGFMIWMTPEQKVKDQERLNRVAIYLEG